LCIAQGPSSAELGPAALLGDAIGIRLKERLSTPLQAKHHGGGYLVAPRCQDPWFDMYTKYLSKTVF
jgi:hypothetical protein